MTAQLAPLGVQKFADNNGNPLALGLVYTFAAGTSTPQATYTDSTQGTPNTNPIVLNFRGEAPIWLDPTLGYKINVTDQFGNQIPGWPVDNIPGSVFAGDSGSLSLPFNLIPNPTNTYTLGDSTHSWAQLYLGANASPAIDTTSGIIGYYPRTAAEIVVGVTPVNYAYAPGDSRRYGVTGNGSTDDTAALNNWIKVVVQAEIAGTLYPGTFLISSPIVINLLGRGFSLLGPSSASCIFVAASSFAGGTAAIQVKGNAAPCQWRIGGWSVQPSGSSGTAVIGMLIGDPTVAVVNILGYNFSTIQDVQVSNFTTLWEYVNCRMIRNVDCSGWDLLGTVVTAVLITQGTASAPCFTGDIIFDTCQYVTTTAASNICVNILSNQGPYSNVTGFGSISGIKFKTCDFYAGSTAIAVTASAASQISDCWWTDGCQIDQATSMAMSFTSLNASTTVTDIHIEHMYINKSTTAGISFASTGTGGQVNQIWVEGCWITDAQGNAINFFGPACQDLHVNNNEIIDCVTLGRAIEFNAASRIHCNFNRANTGILNQKPEWLIGFDSGCTDIEAMGNNGIGMTLSGATIIDQSGVIANKTIVSNPGYNPIGLTGITVTASPFTFTNNTGAPVVVTINSGTVSAVALGGAGNVATATNTSVTVPQAQVVTVTYTVAPTMNYYGL